MKTILWNVKSGIQNTKINLLLRKKLCSLKPPEKTLSHEQCVRESRFVLVYKCYRRGGGGSDENLATNSQAAARDAPVRGSCTLLDVLMQFARALPFHLFKVRSVMWTPPSSGRRQSSRWCKSGGRCLRRHSVDGVHSIFI